MKNHFFDVFTILLLAAILLISCSDADPYSIEGRIDAVVPSEDGLTAQVTIEGRTFLFTPDTLYVDSWGGYFSGRTNERIDAGLTGRYCLAGWGKDDETLLLLDVSGWQQPLFTMKGSGEGS